MPKAKYALIASALGMIVCARAQDKSSAPIKASLCEMVVSPAKFNGKFLLVRGKVSSGFESTFLLDDTCGAEVLVARDGFSYADERTGEYAFWGRLENIRNALGLPQELHWKPLPPRIDLVENDVYRKYAEELRNAWQAGRQKASESTVTVVGRFDYMPEEVEVIATRGSSTGAISYNKAGFGHLNASRIRLVWQRILEISVHPAEAAPMVRNE